jgi:hypothetical protein
MSLSVSKTLSRFAWMESSPPLVILPGQTPCNKGATPATGPRFIQQHGCIVAVHNHAIGEFCHIACAQPFPHGVVSATMLVKTSMHLPAHRSPA